MVFPIIHQFLKNLQEIAWLPFFQQHNNEEVDIWGVDSSTKIIPGNFLRFLANAYFNGDLFSSFPRYWRLAGEEAIMDYRLTNDVR